MCKVDQFCFYGVVAMFLLSLVMLSCSTKSPVEPTTVICSKDFDASGGEFTCGGATIVVAPGALDSVLTVKITQILKPANPPSNYSFPEPGYIIEPHDYSFQDSIAIRINYANDAAVHTLFYLENATDTLWDTLSGVTYNSGIVTIVTDHLSFFAIGRFSPLTAVYVSNSSRGIAAAGTTKDPLPSVNLGIIAALGAGTPYPSVYVAEGTYQEDVTFLDGISVRGGYDPVSWAKKAGAYSTIELKTTAARASLISSPTTISALKIIAGYPLDPSANSIALRADSCTNSLVFDSCWIEAGNGSEGNAGSSGLNGGLGSIGTQGTGLASGRGGPGCYLGGNGGLGTGSGSNGAGPQGGSGGSYNNSGGNGGNGPYGNNGAGGAIGSLIAGNWVAGNGASGNDGICGSGGGGGGGGYFLFWTSGGGGGGGGYGGKLGFGGKGGGGSFAVYLCKSSPIFEDCIFKGGTAGNGGNGGDGGKGGAGGTGGAGGYNSGATGGNGGRAGIGGHGGGGQGGAGGISYCVFNVLNSVPALVRTTYNVGLPGSAGVGGKQGVDGTQADSGVAGTAGEIGTP